MRSLVIYAALIPVVPLLGAIINGLIGKRMGRQFVGAVAVGAMAVAFVLSLLVAHGLVTSGSGVDADLWSWIPMGENYTAPAGVLVDPLSTVMILIVTGVGLLIHTYSLGYMGHDADYSRYFAYLNLFAASMLTLVLANNFLLMFVGWEGVGLCSYLLIGFWYEREAAAAAGKKAFIINRVGDFGFVLGILLLFTIFGTVKFGDVSATAQALHQQGILTTGLATIITLLLFLGATGKSAQLPLWVWLPDAMEGPTPVSALIHAATMVTAGVYMIARANALFALAPFTGAVVAIVGAVTALFAATIALTQYDLKRVLAYSTISQLGLMFLAVGVGAYTAGIFHLMTHAFFKGLLFLGAGSIMHALGNKIDLREMGQLKRFMPQTFFTFWIGWLAIAGVPPFAGFWSKDEILADALNRGTHYWWASGGVLYALGLATSLLTAFYMSRAFYLAFFSDKRMDAHTEEHVHESPASMTLPLWVLAGLSVVGGAIFAYPVLLGHHVHHLGAFLEPVWAPSQAILGSETHQGGVPVLPLMGVATAIAFAGILAARAMYRPRLPRPEPLQRVAPLWNFFDNKWYIERAYHAVFVRGGTALSNVLASTVDQEIIDQTVNGTAKGIGGLGLLLRRVQTGYVRSYAFSILLGVVAIVGFFLMK